MIQAVRPFGDCLQIGMSRELASSIHTHHPKTHTLIESDPLVLEKNRDWLKKHPSIQVIENSWRDALHPLGIFDVIYCELKEVGALWPQFARMRYSDADLDAFCKETSKTFPDQLFRFLHELAHNGQITKEQMEKALHDYKLKGTPPKLKKNYAQTIECLKICLDSHMRKGSLFVAFIDDLSVAYENPLFDQIAMDPYVEIRDYEELIVAEKFGP